VVLAGLGLVGALVLVWSGWSKLGEPGSVGTALRTLRLPHGSQAGRALGAVELLLGLTVVVATPVTWAAMAVWYGALLVAAILLARAASSCGCFGVESRAPGVAHVVTNLVAAVIATAAAVVDAPGLARLVADHGVSTTLVLAAYALLGSWLVVVVLRDLPAVSRPEPAGAVPVFGVAPR
jgi:hypothetical protein